MNENFLSLSEITIRGQLLPFSPRPKSDGRERLLSGNDSHFIPKNYATKGIHSVNSAVAATLQDSVAFIKKD